jgi:hypothetical protein
MRASHSNAIAEDVSGLRWARSRSDRRRGLRVRLERLSRLCVEVRGYTEHRVLVAASHIDGMSAVGSREREAAASIALCFIQGVVSGAKECAQIAMASGREGDSDRCRHPILGYSLAGMRRGCASGSARVVRSRARQWFLLCQGSGVLQWMTLGVLRRRERTFSGSGWSSVQRLVAIWRLRQRSASSLVLPSLSLRL